MKKIFSILLMFLFIACIIGKNCVIEGSKEGLLLWYRTLLPTLLPTMILTKVIMQTDSLYYISKFFSPLFHIFPGVSNYASFAVISGLFCGYPTGAKITADLLVSDKITEKEGNYLLSFCNNISPMFINGYFLHYFIPEKSLHVPFFIFIFFTPVFCSQIFRLSQYKQTSSQETLTSFHSPSPLTLDECMMDSFESIVMIGLYVMIFSIFIKFMYVLPLPDSFLKDFLISLLEITNGLKIASTSQLGKIHLYVYYIFLISFGGICAIFQTASMIRKTSLSIFSYTIKKLIIAIITSFVCYVYLLMN